MNNTNRRVYTVTVHVLDLADHAFPPQTLNGPHSFTEVSAFTQFLINGCQKCQLKFIFFDM